MFPGFGDFASDRFRFTPARKDKCLVIPTQIRSQWLRDPVRSPEWKAILEVFDRNHTPVSAGTGAAAAAGSGESGRATVPNMPDATMPNLPGPEKFADLKPEYKLLCKFKSHNIPA